MTLDNHLIAFGLQFKLLAAYAAATDGTTVAASRSPVPPAAEPANLDYRPDREDSVTNSFFCEVFGNAPNIEKKLEIA